ncbi:MAG: hypothetical protein ACW99A_21095 [Candidatus Kariarchaeaceae archaeon]|jgi:hypothetical protein
MKAEVTEEDLLKMISVGRRALLMTFVVIVIMLFHVLIDLFYHA